MSLELSTIVSGDETKGITLQDVVDLVFATKMRVDGMAKEMDFNLPIPEPSPTDEIEITFEHRETDTGFEVDVIANNLEAAGYFSAVQFDFDFPPGANFISARPGDIISGQGWRSFALGTDGHSKEGLFGAFSSLLNKVDGMKDGVDGPEVIATGVFTGPFVAAFMVDIKRVKFSLSGLRLKVKSGERVSVGD